MDAVNELFLTILTDALVEKLLNYLRAFRKPVTMMSKELMIQFWSIVTMARVLPTGREVMEYEKKASIFN